jgi:putative hydrolase of the HAD superfamily
MIKAVIFDFGNVLFDLNFDVFNANFSALLDEDVSQGFPPSLAKTINEYDAGNISTETFIWRFQHYKQGELDPLSIINCWNSLLDQFPAHRWQFLEELSSTRKLYILSNINELHLNTVYKHISKVHGRVDFETKYFDAVFYSHLIHKIKPHQEVYQFVQEGLELKGEEILFIDDRLENVEGAKKLGWKAFLHNPELDIVDEFDKYLKHGNKL